MGSFSDLTEIVNQPGRLLHRHRKTQRCQWGLPNVTTEVQTNTTKCQIQTVMMSQINQHFVLLALQSLRSALVSNASPLLKLAEMTQLLNNDSSRLLNSSSRGCFTPEVSVLEPMLTCWRDLQPNSANDSIASVKRGLQTD